MFKAKKFLAISVLFFFVVLFLLTVSCGKKTGSESQSNTPTTNDVTISGSVGGSSTTTSSTTIGVSKLPKTGQTIVYGTDDDGTLQKGVAWPAPRFTVGTGTGGSDCVTDNLTGLMWVKAPVTVL